MSENKVKYKNHHEWWKDRPYPPRDTLSDTKDAWNRGVDIEHEKWMRVFDCTSFNKDYLFSIYEEINKEYAEPKIKLDYVKKPV